jgi:hypothetical protein
MEKAVRNVIEDFISMEMSEMIDVLFNEDIELMKKALREVQSSMSYTTKISEELCITNGVTIEDVIEYLKHFIQFHHVLPFLKLKFECELD